MWSSVMHVKKELFMVGCLCGGVFWWKNSAGVTASNFCDLQTPFIFIITFRMESFVLILITNLPWFFCLLIGCFPLVFFQFLLLMKGMNGRNMSFSFVNIGLHFQHVNIFTSFSTTHTYIFPLAIPLAMRSKQHAVFESDLLCSDPLCILINRCKGTCAKFLQSVQNKAYTWVCKTITSFLYATLEKRKW